MTLARPQPVNGAAITCAEFDALPEDNTRRYEIEDGHLLLNARPAGAHIKAAYRLAEQMNVQLPEHLETVLEPELELTGGASPRRVPDLVVARSDWSSARLNVTEDQVLLAIELVSPGESVFRDYAKKPPEYAAAGVPVTWVVDIVQEPPTLTVFSQDVGDGVYRVHPPVSGVYTTTVEPWQLRIDLNSLVGPRRRREPD